MKFKLWESKLCDRLSSWYKATEKDGQVLVSSSQTVTYSTVFYSAISPYFGKLLAFGLAFGLAWYFCCGLGKDTLLLLASFPSGV